MNVPAIVLSYIYIKYVFYKSAICIKRPVSKYIIEFQSNIY